MYERAYDLTNLKSWSGHTLVHVFLGEAPQVLGTLQHRIIASIVG